MEILQRMPEESLSTETQAEVYWLKANYYARRREYPASLNLLRKVLAIDPWNVSYLVQEVINLIHVAKIDDDLRKVDKVLQSLTGNDEGRLDWQEFDQNTRRMEAQHAYELVYARRKLRYLYANGAESVLLDLVHAACSHDAARGTYDFMKLLNTNFDSPNIYWALGIMFKEMWRLETAAVWFEQMLLFPSLSKLHRGRAYLELADCMIWENRDLPKAIEYAKLAMELDERKDKKTMRVLGHAYLKSGQIRQAKLYLDQTDETDPEVRYLLGLVEYRNGSRTTANEIWKPLLTTRSQSLRFHTIKQEVMKFYYDGEPYLKAN
jgi:tetratricopeptide (TPR) repeat protein